MFNWFKKKPFYKEIYIKTFFDPQITAAILTSNLIDVYISKDDGTLDYGYYKYFDLFEDYEEFKRLLQESSDNGQETCTFYWLLYYGGRTTEITKNLDINFLYTTFKITVSKDTIQIRELE